VRQVRDFEHAPLEIRLCFDQLLLEPARSSPRAFMSSTVRLRASGSWILPISFEPFVRSARRLSTSCSRRRRFSSESEQRVELGVAVADLGELAR